MRSALALARRGLGSVWPNPAVGCVIVRDGRMVGRGWTQPGGRPHAEAEALARAGAAARGATAYVTLEPCCHWGRTPPCADALIAAGVGRVVTAMPDPDLRVNGQGHARLEAAGIAVTTGVLAEEAAIAHAGHLVRVTKSRPHVMLKLAVSADGMIGRREGERMLVSGKHAFEVVQIMRTAYDAMMVGIGTVLVDDPRLTVRLPGLARRTPARVVLDAFARMPPTAKLLQTIDEAPLEVFVASDAPHERIAALMAAGAEAIPVAASGGRLDLAAVLQQLAIDGFTRLLAEGGAEVASSLISADLVDEVIIIRAPVIVGADGVRALGGMALSAIERSPRYRQIDVALVGEDVMRTYQRAA